MKISIDLNRFKTALNQKMAEIQSATRPAAQAGIQVIYDQARLNAPVSDGAHFFYGKNSKKTGVRYFFKPGNLRDSIYQVYSKSNSSASRATYHVSWNHTKAPYGFMVEFGTSRAAAHPFLGPAITAKSGDAREAVRRVFLEKVKA